MLQKGRKKCSKKENAAQKGAQKVMLLKKGNQKSDFTKKKMLKKVCLLNKSAQKRKLLKKNTKKSSSKKSTHSKNYLEKN